MSSIFRICFLSFFAVALSSCYNANKGKQLNEVNQLMQRVDAVEKGYKDAHSDSIPLVIQDIIGIELRIKNNYVTDTVDMELARKMDAIKRARKQLKPMGQSLSKLIEGSKEVRSSLGNLRNDIENGAGDRSKYDEFIAFESEKVNQLEALLKEMLDIQHSCFSAYREHREELNSFSMSLVKNK